MTIEPKDTSSPVNGSESSFSEETKPVRLEPLSSQERRRLKAEAHHLPALLRLGKAGVTDSVVEELGRLLLAHELVKIKFVDNKEARKGLTREIVDRAGAHLVGEVGNIAILYRKNPKKKKASKKAS